MSQSQVEPAAPAEPAEQAAQQKQQEPAEAPDSSQEPRPARRAPARAAATASPSARRADGLRPVLGAQQQAWRAAPSLAPAYGPSELCWPSTGALFAPGGCLGAGYCELSSWPSLYWLEQPQQAGAYYYGPPGSARYQTAGAIMLGGATCCQTPAVLGAHWPGPPELGLSSDQCLVSAQQQQQQQHQSAPEVQPRQLASLSEQRPVEAFLETDKAYHDREQAARQPLPQHQHHHHHQQQQQQQQRQQPQQQQQTQAQTPPYSAAGLSELSSNNTTGSPQEERDSSAARAAEMATQNTSESGLSTRAQQQQQQQQQQPQQQQPPQFKPDQQVEQTGPILQQLAHYELTPTYTCLVASPGRPQQSGFQQPTLAPGHTPLLHQYQPPPPPQQQQQPGLYPHQIQRPHQPASMSASLYGQPLLLVPAFYQPAAHLVGASPAPDHHWTMAETPLLTLAPQPTAGYHHLHLSALSAPYQQPHHFQLSQHLHQAQPMARSQQPYSLQARYLNQEPMWLPAQPLPGPAEGSPPVVQGMAPQSLRPSPNQLQRQLSYQLLRRLPIQAEPARSQQPYGMDQVWQDEFDQLLAPLSEAVAWCLVEVESNPSIRASPCLLAYRGRYLVSLDSSPTASDGQVQDDEGSPEPELKSECNSTESPAPASQSGQSIIDNNSSAGSSPGLLCQSASSTSLDSAYSGQAEPHSSRLETSVNSANSDCSYQRDSQQDYDQEQRDTVDGDCQEQISDPEREQDRDRERDEDSDQDSGTQLNSSDDSAFSSNNSNSSDPSVGCPNELATPVTNPLISSTPKPTRQIQTRFRMFIDSAKVRFSCERCGHGWTSMKGRVVFWYELFELVHTPFSNQPETHSGYPTIGYCAYKLFGQQCDVCKIENKFERPMWYPEEVTKVLSNLYNKIGQIYFGFEMPAIDKQRRAGKPKTSHNSSLCQACHDGVCTDRK